MVTAMAITATKGKATRGTSEITATTTATTVGTRATTVGTRATTVGTRATTAMGTIRVTTVTTTGSANLPPWQVSAHSVAQAPLAWR